MEKRILFKRVDVEYETGSEEKKAEMSLEYYLLESEVGNTVLKNVVYGLGIRKISNGFLEEVIADYKIDDAKSARKMIALLADNTVTPHVLADIINDLIKS